MADEWISRQEAGRRIGVSGTMIAKYCAKGMPTRETDRKIPWPAAQIWHAKFNLPQRSGNFRARQAAKTAAPQDQPAVTPDFTRGASWMARQLCQSARVVWPEFIAGLGMTPIPAAQRVGMRAVMVALMGHVFEGWASEYVDAEGLPAIDWKLFGKHAGEIEREYQTLRAEWSAK